MPVQKVSLISHAALDSKFISNFWTRTKPVGDCIEWQGAKIRGYGRLRVGSYGKIVGAHRVAYFIANRVDPAHLCVLHKCDNPSCVNPEHLFLGTAADNVSDKMSKGRHKSSQKAKLSKPQVREIVRRILAGEGNTQIAKDYAVCHASIHAIRYQRSWAKFTESIGYKPRPVRGAAPQHRPISGRAC